MSSSTKAGAGQDRFVSGNPGRDVQRVGTARFLGQDPLKIHQPVWAVTGNLGDSQCYLGVTAKVDAIQAALAARIGRDDLPVRLIPPAYTLGVSDGQLNGTDRMRYSLIGRELANDSIDAHLHANEVKGLVAVVACDKPPVGTLAAVLEHNEPAVFFSDGSIRPGADPESGERIDLVTAFQVAGDPDPAARTRMALHACPGRGSCGGMFTYNTMQSFIAVLGMEPLHMVAPPSDDPRRLREFPGQLVDCLVTLTRKGIKPRDIVTPASLRNALTVAIAMGGSTNVALHSVEIARAAGIDLWKDVISQREFNALSQSRARPHQCAALRRLLDGGHRREGRSAGDRQAAPRRRIRGRPLRHVHGRDARRAGDTSRSAGAGSRGHPFHRAAVQEDGRPAPPARQPRARGRRDPQGRGRGGGIKDGVFTGRARVFNSERALITALETTPDVFADHDMVVIRYEGPRGAPGMPELLDPTSRITALCRRKKITIALMTDARFSGGSVGLVIGHVAPEAYLGGPIALVENGDTIVVDLNEDRLDCKELADDALRARRAAAWQAAADRHGGVHPDVKPVTDRLLRRMRFAARPALQGAGMAIG